MAISTTDDRHVALYDSVSGFAFGPTFASPAHAFDFVDFAARAVDDEAEWAPADGDRDVRAWTPSQLEDAHSRWHDERVDSETGLLKREVELAEAVRGR